MLWEKCSQRWENRRELKLKLSDEVYIVGSGRNGLGISHEYDCHVYLIDGGEETAGVARQKLIDGNLLNPRSSQTPAPIGERKFFVSDVPEKFSQIASRFLGHRVDRITRVDISKY